MSNTNFSSMVVARAEEFRGENARLDKNGKKPVYLNVLNGEAPDRNILPGTIAEMEGIEVGKVYLLSCKETEFDEEYGRQFNWKNLKELDFTEILQAQTLGGAKMFLTDDEKPKDKKGKNGKNKKKKKVKPSDLEKINEDSPF